MKPSLFFPGLLGLTLWLGACPPAPAALDNGVEPNNLGKGDWIWVVPNAITNVGAANLQGLIDYEKSKGMRFLIVKCADGGQVWSQFNSDLVTRCHASGLKVFGFGYVYGSYYGSGQVAAEISAATSCMAVTDTSGVPMDGFMIDAEWEYNGRPNDALTYCQGIRAQYPNRCLMHSPYPVPSYNTSFPYIEFGRYCDVAMPQDYWYDQFSSSGGYTPEHMVTLMNGDWNYWQGVWSGEGDASSIKPLAPIGQGFQGASPVPIPGTELTRFMWCLKTNTPCATAGGVRSLSFWVADQHTAEDWNAIQSINIGNVFRVDSYAGNDNNGVAQVFLPDAADRVASDWQAGINGSWVGWSNLGTLSTSNTPAVGYNADGRMQVFVPDAAGAVWSIAKTAINGGWGSWQNFGGDILGRLSVGYLPSGAMQLFGRSPSNTVQTLSQTAPNGGWSGWSDLGGSCYGDPVVAPNADGRMQVFCRNAANTLHSTWKTGLTENAAWSSWSTFNLSTYSKPCVGLLADGTMQVFTRSGANTVQTLAQNGPNAVWGSASDLGGSCYSDPVLAYGANGTFHLFIRTAANTVAHNAKADNQGGAWSGWVDMGGNCAGSLTAGYNADGRIQIYMRDTSYQLQSTWQKAVNGSTWNSWFSLGGNTPPVGITTRPASQTVNAGQNAAFTVVATNALSYQWTFIGTNLSGATGSSYTVTNAQSGNAGNYSVLLSNHAGTLASPAATLAVTVAPGLCGSPFSANLVQGSCTNLAVCATGTPPLAYQWLWNGAAYGSGASTCQACTAGNYWCVVTNSGGAVTSAPAQVSLLYPPVITNAPQSQTNLAGWGTLLWVGADGSPPLSYQWLWNGAPCGSDSSSYVASNPGSYWVTVSNLTGVVVTSTPALLSLTNALPGHFDEIVCRADGSVQLTLSGTPNTNYTLLESSNWNDWPSLGLLFSGSNGQFQYTDVSATNAASRFYRLRLGP